MKKVLDFLEKYCQWVAVGFGALILLVMLVRHLPGLAQPVKVALLDRDVGPGEVDSVVEADVAKPLDIKMKETIVVPFKVPDYSAIFEDRFTKAPTLAQLPSWQFERNFAVMEGGIEKRGPTIEGPIAVLPILPPIDVIRLFPVQTQILPIMGPDPAAPPVQPVAPDGVAVVPPTGGAPTAPPEGAAPVGPNADPALVAPPQVVVAPARDATIVRVEFKLSSSNIASSFLRAAIPGNVDRTAVLKVELVRERALPGGAWGESTVVGPLEMNKPNVPFPPKDVQLNALAPADQYIGWAFVNQVPILQPDFPKFNGDDPLALAPVVEEGMFNGINLKDFDPAKFTGNLDKLPPDLRKQVLEYRRQKAKEQAERRRNEAGRGRSNPPPTPGGMPPSGGPPGGGRGGSSFNDLPPMTPTPIPQPSDVILFQYAPPGGQPPPGGIPPYQGGPPPQDGSQPEGIFPNPDEAQSVALPGRIAAEPAPNGPWRPVDIKDIDCWAFDDTAKPGETYRYRVRYYMLNPLYKTGNVAKNPGTALQVWIVNDDNNSPWSSAISTPPLTHVFLAATPAANFTSAKFVIFHWQNGQRHKFEGTFRPGDTIGGSKNGIDFISDWTLADIRASAGMNPKNLATLVAPGGTIEVHDFDADKADPLYIKLEAEVAAGVAPATPATPTASR